MITYTNCFPLFLSLLGFSMEIDEVLDEASIYFAFFYQGRKLEYSNKSTGICVLSKPSLLHLIRNNLPLPTVINLLYIISLYFLGIFCNRGAELADINITSTLLACF